MKRTLTLFLLLALGAAALYSLGVRPEASISRFMGRPSTIAPADALNNRGVEELGAGNVPAAVVALREAMALEPDNRTVARNLSIALARRAGELPGESPDAEALLQESLSLWPLNPEGLDVMSTHQYRAGRYGEALRYAEALQEAMPDRPDIDRYVMHLRERIASERGMSYEKGDRFRLLYSDKKKLQYEGELLSVLQTQLDSITAALGLFPESTIDVLLLTDDLGTRAAPFDPFLEGLYDGQVRLYLGEGIGDRGKLVRTVRHEMVHAVLHQAADGLPGWVQEGLAQVVGEEPDGERISILRGSLARAMEKGYVVDLHTMEPSFIGLDNEARSRAYAASLLFFHYLSGRYGDGFAARFAAEVASGSTPEEALRTLTERDLDLLVTEFAWNLREEG